MADENPGWIGHEMKSMLEEAFETTGEETVKLTLNMGFSNLLMEGVIRKLGYEIIDRQPAESGFGTDYTIGR